MPEPDVVLHGGTVITLDRASTVGEAVAVRQGRVERVGPAAALLAEAGLHTRVIDLAGRTVVPGFCDAHPHLDREGLKALGGVSLAGLRSVGEIVEAVTAAASRTPPGEWIVTMPMGGPPHDWVNRPDQLREGRFPCRQDLDAAAPDHPVYIRSIWGWWGRQPLVSVASSRALARAGVTRDTPAPLAVEIVKDTRGEPTGVFLERNWSPVIEYTLFAGLPRFTAADRVEGVRLGTAAYSAAGTTAGYEGHGLSPTVIGAYREVHARGDLPLRMSLAGSLPTARLDDAQVLELMRQWAAVAGGRGTGDEWLRVEGLTLDTAHPKVAEVLAGGHPYEGWAGHFYQALPLDRLVRLGTEAARLGLRVNGIVCYDLETVLAAYEAIDREVPIRERRWTATHVTAATEGQIRRMKALGLVATVTPAFMWMAESRFGLAGLGERGTPIRALLDGGVPVALSTDNVPPSMLFALWEALARWDGDGQRRLGESGLAREEALRLAVQTGHHLTWTEDRRGVLAPGYDADLVVLGENPLICPLDRIRDIPVHLTMVGGRVVFERRDGAGPR